MIEFILLSILNLVLLYLMIFALRKILPLTEFEPLALPKGSIRALITLLIILPVPYIVIKRIEVPGEYWIAVIGIITYYFGTRFFEGKFSIEK